MTQNALELRLRQLETYEAIRQLKARYCMYADAPQHARQFADLFVEDAILDEGEEFMILRGRDEIFRMHQATWEHTLLNQHLAVSPIIEVDGSEASGHWKLLQLTTVKDVSGPAQAFWSCGWYREKYADTSQGWRFQHVEARVHFCSRYENGWAKSPFDELLSDEALREILQKSRGSE